MVFDALGCLKFSKYPKIVEFFFGKQVAHTRHAHMSVVSYNLYGPRSMYACSIYLLNKSQHSDA